MKTTSPELTLERTLLALERDVLDATDEELMTAARELGMNPTMKGSAAYFGVTLLARLQARPRAPDKQEAPPDRRSTKSDGRRGAASREQIQTRLAALTPQEQKALCARFGIRVGAPAPDEEEVILRALARDLAASRKKP
jgi:hypothetical protein